MFGSICVCTIINLLAKKRDPCLASGVVASCSGIQGSNKESVVQPVSWWLAVIALPVVWIEEVICR